MAKMEQNELLNVKETAERLGITSAAVYKAAREGRLKKARASLPTVFYLNDVDAFNPSKHGGKRGGANGRPRKPKAETGE